MSYLLPLVNIHDILMLYNCSSGMLQLRAVMSCLRTKAARALSLQSYLLNYLYLLHFHIMAVLKSNKQSKAYNKGRGQEGAGTFFLPFLNTRRDGRANWIWIPGKSQGPSKQMTSKRSDCHLGEAWAALYPSVAFNLSYGNMEECKLYSSPS